METETILEKIKAVNARLKAGEPGNITEDTHGSFKCTGYKGQALIDCMNLELFGQWGFDELADSEVIWKDGKASLAIAHIRVHVGEVSFTSWGQSQVVSDAQIGDSRKGSVTDGLKKGLAYFSIGNRAFHGLLKK